MAMSIDQVTPRQGILVGLIVSGAGLVIVLRAANVIQAGAIHAPNWVVGIAGFSLLLPGVLMIYYGLRNAFQPFRLPLRRDPSQLSLVGWILVGVLTTGLGLMGTWVAVGPGPRQFQGGFTGSAIEGRILFGIGAAITLTIAAFVWINGFRHLAARRRSPRPDGPGSRSSSPAIRGAHLDRYIVPVGTLLPAGSLAVRKAPRAGARAPGRGRPRPLDGEQGEGHEGTAEGRGRRAR
jgi:hypothetical protein